MAITITLTLTDGNNTVSKSAEITKDILNDKALLEAVVATLPRKLYSDRTFTVSKILNADKVKEETKQGDFPLTRDDDGKFTLAQYERDREARATAHDIQVKLMQNIARAEIAQAIRNGGSFNPKAV